MRSPYACIWRAYEGCSASFFSPACACVELSLGVQPPECGVHAEHVRRPCCQAGPHPASRTPSAKFKQKPKFSRERWGTDAGTPRPVLSNHPHRLNPHHWMADADENRHSTVLSLYIETAGNSRKNLATRFKPASSPETDAVVAIGCIVRTYEQCEAEPRRMERKFAFALVPPQVASPDAPCCGRKTDRFVLTGGRRNRCSCG